MASELCPDCNIRLGIKFLGEARIGSCSLCGFEIALKPIDNTIQSRLRR